MATNNNMIRMSGMNSGLDTESIINALTAQSKLKITKQNRQLLKYQATQEAYREVISRMQNLKSKYFDILNKNSNLKGSSMWNQFASTTTVNGEEKKIAGFSAQTSIDSLEGTYELQVINSAAQATRTGKPLTGAAKLELSSLTANESYGMSITVGSETKTIVFQAGANDTETLKNINTQLCNIYGESKESMTDGVGGDNVKGMIYVDDNGQFVSREGKGIAVTAAGHMDVQTDMNIGSLKSGNNAVTIQVGEKTLNVSFQTLEQGYFNWDVDEPIYNDRGEETGRRQEMSAEKGKLYQQVLDDYVESKKYEAYNTWKESAGEAEKNALKESAFAKAEVDQREKYLDKYLNKEFDAYAKANNLSFVNASAKQAAFDGWKSANFVDNDDSNELYKGFKNYYYTHDITAELTPEQIAKRDEKLDQFIDVEYQKYVDGLESGVTAVDKDTWRAAVRTEGNALYNEDVKSGYEAIENKYNTYTGYELDHDGWIAFSYNEYEAYKEFTCTVSEESIVGDPTTFDHNILVDHFNKSSLENSLGAASIKTDTGVVNFSVNFNGNTLEVTAEESFYEYEYEKMYAVNGEGKLEVVKDANGNDVYATDPATGEKIVRKDSNGNPIIAKDENGKPKFKEDEHGETVTSPAKFSMTSAKSSVSDFNIPISKSSVSQISNSTKIDDLGIQPNDNGKYEFSINGVNFSFDGDTTVKDMIRKVNASSANVKLSYSSLDNAFKITSNEYGVSSRVDLDDGGSGFFDALGLGADARFEPGKNLEVKINGKTYESASSSITADGTTFNFAGIKTTDPFEVEIKKDYSAITDTIKGFVEEYNKLIEDVYKLLDEKPDKDYYFLADADKEDMDLSEKQEEKWESKAKQGLLYHDSTISSVMTKLRTSLMGAVQGADGTYIGLAQIGIKTSSDYKDHGKLVLDEEALTTAIMERGEDIARLFSDAEDGIMNKFAAALDGAVGTTGDRGTLINKAGLATGSSATDNFIYNQMKRITQNISKLEKRYEKEQDRLWKKYSAMESMLGTINSQSATLSSYFGGTM